MIETRRLKLLPATQHTLRAELARDFASFARLLGVAGPTDWPPELYDADAMNGALAEYERDPEGAAAWGFYYFARKRVLARPTLVGAGGFKGPPRDGAVEIGYSVLERERRKGYAREAVLGMVARAFAAPEVKRVLAHTLPELAPSMGVLQSCGFALQPNTLEEGAIMFAHDRG